MEKEGEIVLFHKRRSLPLRQSGCGDVDGGCVRLVMNFKRLGDIWLFMTAITPHGNMEEVK